MSKLEQNTGKKPKTVAKRVMGKYRSLSKVIRRMGRCVFDVRTLSTIDPGCRDNDENQQLLVI